MKSTSAERGTGPDRPVVRPARLDRQLSDSPLDPCYADPHLERLVAMAGEQAAEQARAEGYARGFAEGSRAAAERARALEERRRQEDVARREAFHASAASALTTLGSAARALRESSDAVWAEVADALVDGTLTLARAALGRELGTVDAEVAEAVRLAARTAGQTDLTIRVHPDDLSVLSGQSVEGLPDEVRFTADPEVPRGGALAVDGSRQVLAHLESSLAAAEEVLRS